MARDRSDGGGWIHLWRSARESPFHFTKERRPATRWEALLDLWLDATFEDEEVASGSEIVLLKRGDVLTSIMARADRWRWGRQRVRHFLAASVSRGEMVLKSSSQRTIITLCNYPKWNDPQPSTRPTKNQRQYNGKPTTVHVQESEESEEPKKLRKIPESETDFDRFWDVWPKKVGKGEARRAWGKLNGSGPDILIVIEAVRWQSAQEQWHRDEGRFIPNPATWINQQRWLDEPTHVTPPKAQEPKGWEGIREYVGQRTGRLVGPSGSFFDLAESRDVTRSVPPLLGGGETPDPRTVREGDGDGGEDV